MRSAHETTSPSGVVGAGRLQEWLRMPSSVSAQRLSGASVTSAPQVAWSYPPATYGDRASSLACPPGPWPQSWPRAIASVRTTLSPRARRPMSPPGRPRGRGSGASAGGHRGRRRPASCRRGGGTPGRGGCGRDHARSRCATRRAPPAGRGSAPTARVALAPAARARSPGGRGGGSRVRRRRASRRGRTGRRDGRERRPSSTPSDRPAPASSRRGP